MDEGSGSTTADSSGNGNTGTLTGSPTWVTGKFGDALSFNGTTQYVEIPNSTSLTISGAMSIGGWINESSTGGTSATGIDKQWSYRIVATTANTSSTQFQMMLTDSGGIPGYSICSISDRQLQYQRLALRGWHVRRRRKYEAVCGRQPGRDR